MTEDRRNKSARGAPMWHRLITLDADGAQSLQAQLREALVRAILDGHVDTRAPLPSSRELARQLGVARNTVVLAYQHLVDENFILSRERRGYFVNVEMLAGRVAAGTPKAATSAGPATVVDLLEQRNIHRPLDWASYPYPFIYGQVDPGLFPVNDWREASRLAQRVGAIGEWTHDRVDHDDELLIEQIQKRILPRRGVWADTDEILVTAGAQNALFIAAQLLIGTHTRVGLEDPCYVDARNIFSLFTSRLQPFPVGPDGVQTDERLAECSLIYVTPSHQCPTTTTMPLAAREALLKEADRHDVTIIEDDYESELNFIGEPTPALKSLDAAHRVIYVGSLSKTLAPGLRVGFMVGPAAFIRQARALRRLMYRHPPSNNQRTVAHFLALGHHDATLLRLSRAFRERWQTMDQALGRLAPLSAVAPAFGGTSFWVQLPDDVPAEPLESAAREAGIIISAGDSYFFDPGQRGNFCRLGFSSIANDRIEPGLESLAALIRRRQRASG